MDTKGSEIKGLKLQLNVVQKASMAHLQQLNVIENQMEQLRCRRHAIFRTCRREEIDLPLIEGELPADVDPDSPEQTAKLLLNEDKIVSDFSSLNKKLQGLNKTQQEEASTAFIERINTLSIERDGISPNLKAIERLGDVEKRLGSTETDFEEAKVAARKAIEDFKKVREERCQRFMKAFDPSSGINAEYFFFFFFFFFFLLENTF
eukprot:TRINITY_DN6928_c0_g1_i19.p1 TRINITY_DN6928_c0_g1~~TRINITY_DN6928_c0_g1_i19.p1  ORF type:complete len:206 (+),score=53.97 TRINITY_DN6928_c0_g1_i19:342-959(+)